MFSGTLRVMSGLSSLAGIFSILILARQLVEYGLTAPMQAILDWYDQLLGLLLGWATTPLNQVLDTIERLFRVSVNLRDEWRHVFVLTWLYFGSDLRVYFRWASKPYAVFAAIWSVTCATIGSVGYGVSQSSLALAWSAGAVVFYVFGLTVFYSLIERRPTQSVLRAFSVGLFSLVTPAALVAALTVWSSSSGFLLGEASIPTLGWFGIFLALLTVYWIARSVWNAFFDRGAEQSTTERLWQSSGVQVAILMATTIAGAFGFLALNAGLQLAGL